MCPRRFQESGRPKIGGEGDGVQLDIKWGDGIKGEIDVHWMIFLSWRGGEKLGGTRMLVVQVTLGEK
ncbi:hypothetical protein Tco_0178045 [Tanacetum coccineum]